jgi:integrase
MYLDMPKIAKELSAIQVRQLNRVGWHAVGGVAGLLLQIRKPATAGSATPRSWILRLRIAGKRSPIGLGSYPQVSLAEAREMAKKLSLDANGGIDLLARKRSQRSALIAAASKNKTFKECAEAYISAHSSDYSNEKHRKQWSSSIETFAYPLIGSMLVADITMRNVLDVLLQERVNKDGTSGKLWHTTTETAKRLLDRIRRVLDYATVNEYRSGTNPATWKGYLDTQLPSPSGITKVKHQPALPYEEMGDFMSHLRSNPSISAKALTFLILTGVRSGSVRMATWAEIDLDKKVWIIPPEHTKTKIEHRVPLQQQAIDLLNALPRIEGVEQVFPSPRGKALSDMALNQIMRGMKERGEFVSKAVPHGFRSTFRDWAAEQTNFPDEVRKVASGHKVGDAVLQSYQRTDLLEKRRRLMSEWADFIDMPSTQRSGTVTPLRRSQ